MSICKGTASGKPQMLVYKTEDGPWNPVSYENALEIWRLCSLEVQNETISLTLRHLICYHREHMVRGVHKIPRKTESSEYKTWEALFINYIPEWPQEKPPPSPCRCP